MAQRFVIGLMAANRTGILAAVTTALAELGGDIQEVSQTVLQKFFTIILAADFPDHRQAGVIVAHLEDACRPFGVQVILKDPLSESFPEEGDESTEKYFLTLTGNDAPGIICQITGRLAREQIDITDLYGVSQGPDRSFVMIMELAVPGGVDALALQQELERLGQPVGLLAKLQHENIFVATNDPRPVRISAGRRLRRD